MTTVYEETKLALLHDENAVVVRIERTEGSTPGKTGCLMLVTQKGKTYGTIGGGELEFFCTKAALDVYKSKQSYTRYFSLDSTKHDDVSMACGGSVSVSFNYLNQNTSQDAISNLFNMHKVKLRALIFGGGHVCKELCPILEKIGFDVVILDDRAEYASKEMHPTAAKCILCNYDDITKSVSISENDYVIIMTHNHIGDRKVLLQACRTDAKYIGCMGSRKKVAETKEFLKEQGISEKVIESIHSPIGLPIGGNSPAEIAISIAAELIQISNQHI